MRQTNRLRPGLVLVISFFCLLNLVNQVVWGIEVSGPQEGIWTLGESPYIVTGNIIVPEGATLTIEPGIVVKFAGYYNVRVSGTLDASGSLGKRIIFTSLHDKEFGITAQRTTVLPTNKDWQGIEFAPSSRETSKLEYCIIRYGDKPINALSANPLLSHIIIADCTENSIVINGRRIEVQEGSDQDYNLVVPTTAPAPLTTPTALNLTPTPASPTEKPGPSKPEPHDLLGGDEFTFGEILVVTAAKREQKISEAPAIITTYAGDQIEQMPVENLYELLTYIPGITTMETYYGYTSVTFRGVMQTHYNNKSLLLLNGHPLYETVVGSYYLEEIPKNIIKRIEVIRGPGSSLYGTNAFSGVINIITKDANDLEGLSLAVAAGSFKTLLGSLSYGKKSNNVDFYFGGSLKNSQGYPFKVAADEEGRSGEPIYPEDKDAYENDFMNLYSSLKYNGLKLQGIIFHNEKDKFGLVPTLVSTGERKIDGYGIDLKYDHKWSEKFVVSGFVWYDYFSKFERIEKYPPSLWKPGTHDTLSGNREFQEYSGSKIGSEFQLNFNLSNTTSFLAGIVYEQTKSNPYLFLFQNTGLPDLSAVAYPDKHASYDLSAYFQTSWNPMPAIGIIGGIRHNKNRDYGAEVTPRIGLVINVKNLLFLKTLYGQAFRAPNFFEKYVQTKNVLSGDQRLMPEKVNTLDLGTEFKLKKIIISFNYFYLTTDKMITRSAIADSGTFGHTRPTPKYGNSGGQRIKGAETEFSYHLLPEIFLFTNCSYITGVEKATNENIEFLAHIIANAGFNWKIGPKIKFGAYGQYVGKREGKLSNGSLISINPIKLGNLKLCYQISPSLEFSFICKNVLDARNSYPEYIRKKIATIPGDPPRAFYLGLQTKL